MQFVILSLRRISSAHRLVWEVLRLRLQARSAQVDNWSLHDFGMAWLLECLTRLSTSGPRAWTGGTILKTQNPRLQSCLWPQRISATMAAVGYRCPCSLTARIVAGSRA